MTGVSAVITSIRLAPLSCLLAVALLGCGRVAPPDAQPAPTRAQPRVTAPPSALKAPPSPSVSPLDPATEQMVVTGMAAQAFAAAREPLLAAIKEEATIEAVTEFAFDREARALKLSLASVFRASEDARFELLYEVATGLTPLLWNQEVANQVQTLDSLPFLWITVDGQSFVCPGPAMVALGDKELSAAAFPTRCAKR
jgi:hypothetical protein